VGFVRRVDLFQEPSIQRFITIVTVSQGEPGVSSGTLLSASYYTRSSAVAVAERPRDAACH